MGKQLNPVTLRLTLEERENLRAIAAQKGVTFHKLLTSTIRNELLKN